MNQCSASANQRLYTYFTNTLWRKADDLTWHNIDNLASDGVVTGAIVVGAKTSAVVIGIPLGTGLFVIDQATMFLYRKTIFNYLLKDPQFTLDLFTLEDTSYEEHPITTSLTLSMFMSTAYIGSSAGLIIAVIIGGAIGLCSFPFNVVATVASDAGTIYQDVLELVGYTTPDSEVDCIG